MNAVLAALLLSASVPHAQHSLKSYLYQPSFSMDHLLREPAVPYQPQPGDIFLATDKGVIAKIGHRLGGTGAPQHSGVIVARSDGRLGLLEGGPFNTIRCRVVEVESHFAKYAEKERVWIRARRMPLTADQSLRLTAFAEAVDGKRFAVVRLLGQLTPFRSRGVNKTEHRGMAAAKDFEPGGCEGLKRNYFCSELVTEALTAARAIDPETARPAATYPRDLFFGRSVIPWLDLHLTLCDWHPPARWVLCPGAVGRPNVRPWLDRDGMGPMDGKK